MRLRLALGADDALTEAPEGSGLSMCACLSERDARRLPLSDDVFRSLVVSQTDEPRVPQMVLQGPFNEFELTDEHRFQPPAIDHLLRGQACTPAPGFACGRFANGHAATLRG